MTEELDPISQTVLQHIQQGNDDIQKITEQTTLTNSQVNYRFKKLEDFGLINVDKPEGWTTRIINGQKRRFKTPKTADLTAKGEEQLHRVEEDHTEQYQDLNYQELVEHTKRLENRLQNLETKFSTFQRQIMRYLD